MSRLDETSLDALSPERRALLLRRLRARQKPVVERMELAASPRRERGEPFPLSSAQRRLWFLHRFEPERPSYAEALRLELDGEFEPSWLEAALAGVVRRHEILRSRFPEVGGEPVKIVEAPRRRPLPRIDLSRLAPLRREREAVRQVDRVRARRFDLEGGEVLRGALLRIDRRRHQWLLAAHHIAIDYWALERLLGEIGEFYAAAADGRAARLPRLPLQYGDFADWQRRWLAGPEVERLLTFWRGALEGIPSLLELPTDRPRPTAASGRGARRPFFFSAETSEHLRAFCTRRGVTLFVALLAAFRLVLARWSGRADLVVGTPVAGRDRVELENMIGCFLNMLVLRDRVAPRERLNDVLESARSGFFDAFEHRALRGAGRRPAPGAASEPPSGLPGGFQPAGRGRGDADPGRRPGASPGP